MKNLSGIICWGYVENSQKNPTFRWVFAKSNIEGGGGGLPKKGDLKKFSI